MVVNLGPKTLMFQA